ncbi:MAG: DUF4011 domain-containing protein [Burkholderiaceae bacterium]|nr:MAG: DUF4011 domain-containing protein [Burkholderiaceae bacterium]
MNQIADADVALTAEALEHLRNRLLDLTGRNRLLNFHHPKKSSLRVIDELPDQIVSTLLAGEEMRFGAIPEPTEDELVSAGYLRRDGQTGTLIRLRGDPSAKEWAERLGHVTSYEVPHAADDKNANKHADKVIQTLFYPFELEARLKALSQASESAVQEMGTNILYLAVGFLEWYESKDSELQHIAPLMLVPVALHKGRLNPETRAYEYSITYSGEDLIPNLSLREKLRVDFGMALPDLDESTIPEDYFLQINELIERSEPRWCVHRYISLALFNFTKLLMYLDLDPNNWPAECNVANHPVVSQILSKLGSAVMPADSSSRNFGFGEEYAIDRIETIHTNYPLIDDADSSQHSALIDAVDGKNLVIEGPPGTGKSQTITNLIAAAIAQGKTVLFVAEKLAALEVVWSRLDFAGLGEFCLELHSHKAQKRKLLEELNERMIKHGQYCNPQDFQADVTRYEELKIELAGYAEKMNRRWKHTGKTLHDVFAAATRYRNAISVSPEVVRPDNCTGKSYDPAAQRRAKDRAHAYQSVYQVVAQQLGEGAALQSHPWFGVSNGGLQIFDTDRVVESLGAWQESLQKLAEQRQILAATIGCDGAAIPEDVSGLRSLLTELQRVPTLRGDEILEALPKLRGKGFKEASHQRELFEEIQRVSGAMAQVVDVDLLRDSSIGARIDSASKNLSELVGSDVTLAQLTEAIGRLASVSEDLEALQQPLRGLRTALGDAAKKYLTLNASGLLECKKAIELLASLDLNYWEYRSELFGNDELDNLLHQLCKEVDDLHGVEDKLNLTFAIKEVMDEGELRAISDALASGGRLRWFKSGWRSARKRLLSHAANSRVRFTAMKVLLGDAITLAAKRSVLQSNKAYKEGLGKLFQGQETDLDALKALRAWYKSVRQTYGAGFGRRAVLGDAILNFPASSAGAVRALAQRQTPQQLSDLLATLNDLKAVFTPAAGIQSNDTLLIGDGGAVPDLLVRAHDAMRECSPLADDDGRSIADLRAQARELASLHANIRSWNDADLDNRMFGGRLGLDPLANAGNEQGMSALDHTLRLAAYCDREVRNHTLIGYIYRTPAAATFKKLSDCASSLHAAIDAEATAREAYAKLVTLDLEAWRSSANSALSSLIARNQLALNDPASLQNWLDYIRVRGQLAASGFTCVAAAVEESMLPIDQVEDACLAGAFDVLARQALKEDDKLARFSGKSHDVLCEQFAKYDNALKQLQRRKIAWAADQTDPPTGSMGGRVSDLTELALLEHECSKKKRHIPIRQLLKRAGRALLALKPCFMMSPMSVAQYLAPGDVSFDLVVMDEASQIKPQDAIGAVARGGQLVVVGDPNQLPPTSFFDRLEDDDVEDPTGAEEAESILDAVWPLFQRRLLRWHYRSQHPDLIAFSNAFFYKDLVLFPSPYKESDKYGIHYHRLSRGCFVGRRNMEEARVIANAVQQHFRVSPKDTLGVATMNAEQRLQIEAAIESLAKDDPAFQKSLGEDGERRESLFIKNLENVQGDERDVIFVSMTYGPSEPGGKVMQRFGPINTETGWRRLNVLFTRARKRMHVFSSMGSADVLVGASSKRGVKALHDFLSYCETGILSQTDGVTGKEPDSDFEVAVMDALRTRGFDCVPQVGVAGFFIDVAVIDPGKPGHYLMGIECDGATYHSAKSTRDRDRLRQSILERLGWRIRRIWSTDWYKNPSAAFAPMLKELDELKSAIPPVSEGEPEYAGPRLTVEEASANTDDKQADAITHEGGDLQDMLTQFDNEVIRKQVPDTPESKRLLRPAMLEALAGFRPTNKVEFLEQVPRYLREGTEVAEGKYLEQVFEIINASLEEPYV